MWCHTLVLQTLWWRKHTAHYAVAVAIMNNIILDVGNRIPRSSALCYMMTSSNGNIFRVTCPLCREFTQPFIQCADQRKHWSSASRLLWGEFTGHRWIPPTKGQLRGKKFHLMTPTWTEQSIIVANGGYHDKAVRSTYQLDVSSISTWRSRRRKRYWVSSFQQIVAFLLRDQLSQIMNLSVL